MLINSKFIPKNSCLCLYRTHSYFYCQSIFNKNSTGLIFTILLYFASHFFKFWGIILSSVSNICNIKLFSRCFWIIHISPPYSITSTSFFLRFRKLSTTHPFFKLLNPHYSISYFLVFHWHFSHFLSSSHIYLSSSKS